MIYKEVEQDLFKVDTSYYLAHCISSDCALGAGIAVEFEKRYKLRDKLQNRGSNVLKHPTCILEGQIFNLITKQLYWHKPTYHSLAESLKDMKAIAESKKINKIAMPTIGSGLDRLKWPEVSKIIQEVFEDTDIEILVCFK